MSKGKGKAPVIIGILIILAVLAGLAWYLERQRHPPVKPGPTPQATAPVETGMIIKSCLFDLGLQKNQVEIHEHTFQVKSSEKLTREQLEQAFKPLDKYGQVEVKDVRHIRIEIDSEPWRIEITYPKVASIIPPVKPVVPVPAEKGRMAIIVDDMGMEMKPAERLAAIDGDLTFSVLPLRPFSKDVAQYLHSRGHEILLHLPMQGNSSKDPGEGAIYKDMTADHIQTVLLLDLRSVPYIAGVNNHEGSEVTQQKEIMQQVEQEIKKRGLFFIDSLTTGKSMGSSVAREIGLPHNARDVFLDNEQNDAYIMKQLAQLKSVARKHQSAIGICHPHPATIAVLTREIPKLKQEGITLVRVSSFVKK